jgi:hypothetical protein
VQLRGLHVVYAGLLVNNPFRRRTEDNGTLGIRGWRQRCNIWGQSQRHTGCDDSKFAGSLPMAEPDRTAVSGAWSEPLAAAWECNRGPPV